MPLEIKPDGAVCVDSQNIGTLKGVLFTQAKNETELRDQTSQQTITQELAREIEKRIAQIAACSQDALSISDAGEILWSDNPVGVLKPGPQLLKPNIELIGGELASQDLQDMAVERLKDFINHEIEQKLSPLLALKTFLDSETDDRLAILARPIVRGLWYNHGVLYRPTHRDIASNITPEIRAKLHELGIRAGLEYIYMPELIKQKPARLLSLLYAYAYEKKDGPTKPFLPPNGRTSMPAPKLANDGHSHKTLAVAGYCSKGLLYVRIDMLNRLGFLINQARLDWGDEGRNGKFRIKQEMLSIMGCSLDELRSVLRAIGYKQILQDFTKEQQAIHQEYVKEVTKRHKAIMAIKAEDPNATYDIPAIKSPSYAPKQNNKKDTDKNDEGKTTYKPLEDYIPTQTLDKDGNLVFVNKLELWYYDPPWVNKQSAQDNVSTKSHSKFSKDWFSNNKSKDKPSYKKNAGRKVYSFAPPKPVDKSASPFAALAELIPDNPKNKKDK